MRKQPVTQEWADVMLEEIDKLKNQDIPQAVKLISDMKTSSRGEKSSEYFAAIEVKNTIDERIRELELKISNVQIINSSKINDVSTVRFGAIVCLCTCLTKEKVTYKIVGEDEASLGERKISYKSPLARVLIGKAVDDLVVVDAPGGELEYQILDITYK